MTKLQPNTSIFKLFFVKIYKSHRFRMTFCLFLLAVPTLAVYWQVRHHEFLNYDDGLYVTENRNVQIGLNLKNVLWALTATHASNWHPVTWLSHMLDCQIYGLRAGGHHLTSVLLHVGNSILLFLVFNRMTGALLRSAFVAALFALHPIHVESVAWVAERKDVLSTFFWLATMWAYITYVHTPSRKNHFLVLTVFAFGLMAKPMLVTLPFVLLLMDYWPLGRYQISQRLEADITKGGKTRSSKVRESSVFRLIQEKVPFLILAVGSSLVTIVAQQRGEALASLDKAPFPFRIANALVSYVAYIVKTVWPGNLSVLYPHPGITLPTWQAIGAGVCLLLITVFVVSKGRKHPYLLVGWLWYLVTLIPVIGLVQVGAQSMADRYTYVPLIGIFVSIVWWVSELIPKRRNEPFVLSVLAGILLSALGTATWFQVQHWQNNRTLFKHALEVTSNNWIARNNLGNVLFGEGKIQEAIAHYTKAVQIYPIYVDAYKNLGNAFLKEGKTNEAIAYYTKALDIKTDDLEARISLGSLWAELGKHDLSIAHYTKAIKFHPNDAEAHCYLGTALAKQGRFNEAIMHFRKALDIEPKLADAEYALGMVLAKQGRFKEAIPHYSKAVGLDPKHADAHNNLGIALARQGRLSEAREHFVKALSINPDHPQARQNLYMLEQGSTQSNRKP